MIRSWGCGRFRGACRVAAVGLSCAAILLVRAQPANAQSSDICVLSRSPIPLSPEMPDDIRCAYDEDGNGLDDQIEEQIAACVVPAIH